FFTQVWDYSILEAGIAFAPGPLLAAATAFISGRLADGRQPAAFGAVGGFVFAAGCLWFITHATAEPAYLTAILPGQILTGTGVGLMLPSFTATAAATLRPDQLSTGIGVQTMFRQIGAALGLATWVAIVGTRSPRAGRSCRSPRCSPGSPSCRWLVGDSSIHCLCDLRRDPRAIPALLR